MVLWCYTYAVICGHGIVLVLVLVLVAEVLVLVASVLVLVLVLVSEVLVLVLVLEATVLDTSLRKCTSTFREYSRKITSCIVMASV